MKTVSGPLRPLLLKAPMPTAPTTPTQLPSSAIPFSAILSPGIPSPVVPAWIRLVASDSGHILAQGVSQTHLSCLTRFLETFTERLRLIPSSMIHSAAAVSNRTSLAVASLMPASLRCCLLHLILVAEAWGVVGCKYPAMVEPEEGGPLRVGPAPQLMA